MIPHLKLRTFQPFAFQKVFRINLRKTKSGRVGGKQHMAVSISTFVTIKIKIKIKIGIVPHLTKISILLLVQKNFSS